MQRILKSHFLKEANNNRYEVTYTKDNLDTETVVQAVGHESISIFSGDDASSNVLEKLWDLGVRYIALCSAGYNNIPLNSQLFRVQSCQRT